jgi:hypothetical protein
MSDPNQKVREYLQYYVDMKVPPYFAVMLKGRWGVGKTWFVEQFIQHLAENGTKVLYVSLYGITQTQQIGDEFFRQLHPVLSSKQAAFAGKLLKGFVKGALKVDLNGDGKDDGTVTVNIPDLILPQYLQDTNGLILVFDDLERCAVPIADLLGYINHFVEHDGRKVVIVCNEEVLAPVDAPTGAPAAAQDERSYIKIKEKLVGSTLEIEPEFPAAIDKFISEVDLATTRDFIRAQQDLVERIYVDAGYKNLRHIRQAIMDFARMVEALDWDIRKNAGLMGHLLTFFLLYSFEIKSSTMSAKQIKEIKSSFYAATGKSEKELENNLYKRLAKKYGGVSIVDSLLPAAMWQRIFETGLFDAQEINEALHHSKYFLDQHQPDWVRLWHAFTLTDEQFDTTLSQVDQRFTALSVQHLGELRHIVSTLMLLSECGVYGKSKEDIAMLGLKNMERMDEQGVLATQFEGDTGALSNTGYGGMGYHRIESDHFKTFSDELKKMGTRAVEKRYPSEAAALLVTLKNDTPEFVSQLVHSNYRASKYVSVPILSHISPNDFAAVVQSLPPSQLFDIQYMLRERYGSSYYRDALKPELPWLHDVAAALEAVVANRAGRISAIQLGQLKQAVIDGARQFGEGQKPLAV